ncbi:hypothetical protein C1I95_20085 [Micromonospora craterilacus]|uniref:Teneurin NHL domain-containing protein n=1 Tax=Micromonospora craterilacus TaxID=1655439 RepID=A0A2W2DYT7_9ACTN|nr:hypothetical protein [Micromonospora craterilacus]PZG15201.1 hypothetical protein C1I95_20085 [Micromonospora craterilacus]
MSTTALVFPQDNAANAEQLVVVAGVGTAGNSGDGGPAASAGLNTPSGVAVAPDGTVYLSDTGNHIIRAVSPAGTITTVAGTGRPGSPGTPVPQGTPGTEVDLGSPTSLALGPDGTLYLADVALLRVFALAPDGTISVLAGTGLPGSAGEGGPATAAAIGQPGGLAVAADRTLYLGDLTSRRVRAVAPSGTITTVAGNGASQLTAAGGPATEVPVPAVNSITVAPDGDVWLADGLVLHRLRGGELATVTAPGAGGVGDGPWALSTSDSWPPAEPPLNNVAAIAAGTQGIYLYDQGERKLLRLGLDETVRTVATLDPQTVGTLVPQLAVNGSGTVYLLATSEHRLYAVRDGGGSPDDDPAGDGTRWWLLAAGAGVIVLLAVGWAAARRRRP